MTSRFASAQRRATPLKGRWAFGSANVRRYTGPFWKKQTVKAIELAIDVGCYIYILIWSTIDCKSFRLVDLSCESIAAIFCAQKIDDSRSRETITSWISRLPCTSRHQLRNTWCPWPYREDFIRWCLGPLESPRWSFCFFCCLLSTLNLNDFEIFFGCL